MKSLCFFEPNTKCTPFRLTLATYPLNTPPNPLNTVGTRELRALYKTPHKEAITLPYGVFYRQATKPGFRGLALGYSESALRTERFAATSL